MASEQLQTIGQIANLPIGELFRTIALGIAEAQTKLDQSGMAVAELMSGTRVAPDGTPIDSRVYFGAHFDSDKQQVIADRVSMIELGFTPTFYQFVDTVIEVKLAMNIAKVEHQQSAFTQEGAAANMWSHTGGGGVAITATTVDATYASSFNFKAEFSSVVKTKLVPIPPPALLEDRIQQSLNRQQTSETAPPIPEAPSAPSAAAAAPASAQAGTRSRSRSLWTPTTPAPEPAASRAAPPASRAKGQLTQVEVHVGKASKQLGLDIKVSGRSIIPGRKKVQIESVGDDAKQTAKLLAEELELVLPDILTTSVRGSRVTIKFSDQRQYEVVERPPGTRTNRLEISDK